MASSPLLSSLHRFSRLIFCYFSISIILNSCATHGINPIASRFHSASLRQSITIDSKLIQESQLQDILYENDLTSLSCKDTSNVPFILGGSKMNDQKGTQEIMKRIGSAVKLISGVGVVLSIAYIIYENKETLFDGKVLQSILLQKLNKIKDLGLFGLIFYSFGLSLWEMFGLTTIPVETVAGMTFSFHHAIFASIIGKVFGALMAFTVGRYFLGHIVKERFAENDVLQLASRSITYKPFRSSLYMKYAPFPELFKNLGLSIMPPVSFITFVLATCTHGIPYTILWTYLGKDTSLRLRASESLPPNHILNGIILATTIFGIIGSPALLALWIKDMQQYRHRNDKN